MLVPVAAAEITLEQQRNQFLQAKKELRAGNTGTFARLTEQLQDYPLYPYLLYEDLSRRIWKAKNEEIIEFLNQYPDLPITRDLRRKWLGILARRGHWQTYADHYTRQTDEILQCYYLQARVNTNRTAYLLEDIRTMWLLGESLPDQCDPAFKLLYASELVTPELLWERIRLSMANGKTGLASYLGRRLDEEDRKWVSRWVAMHNNPSKGTSKPGFKDLPVAREILVHGINRLSRRDINRAIRRWGDLQAAYDFSAEQTRETERNLAIRAARKDHSKAIEMLDRLSVPATDEDIFHWRVVTALDQQDWQALLKWTADEPPEEEAIRQRWLYWQGRALEETGANDAADNIFRSIAGERDYYGFMASDRLGQSYQLDHHAVVADVQSWQEITDRPAVMRARELYHLGLSYAARREWYLVQNQLTNAELQIAAAVAAGWERYDRAIMALGKARAYDDLVLRFPLAFEPLVKKYAEKRNLDQSWMYALTRAESAFMVDARSPSGALGLMQVMPATGQQTAKSIGFRTYKNSYLLEADKNVTIGSAYLMQMYERFGNNIVLATAAYNAGPNAVARWLPRKECMQTDIWVEQIPYTETRKYVSRILYFSSIYDWRLDKDIMPVANRMPLIPTRKGIRVAGFTCHDKLISQQ